MQANFIACYTFVAVIDAESLEIKIKGNGIVKISKYF